MSKYSKVAAGIKEQGTEAGTKKGVGRPAGRAGGKSSDPNYRQVTAYVNRETYQAVKIVLLQEDEGREFSDLVGQLLDDWLKSRR